MRQFLGHQVRLEACILEGRESGILFIYAHIASFRKGLKRRQSTPWTPRQVKELKGRTTEEREGEEEEEEEEGRGNQPGRAAEKHTPAPTTYPTSRNPHLISGAPQTQHRGLAQGAAGAGTRRCRSTGLINRSRHT